MEIEHQGDHTRCKPCDTILREREAAHADRLTEKGHECFDYVVHGYHPDFGDYYTCIRCGDLRHVG